MTTAIDVRKAEKTALEASAKTLDRVVELAGSGEELAAADLENLTRQVEDARGLHAKATELAKEADYDSAENRALDLMPNPDSQAAQELATATQLSSYIGKAMRNECDLTILPPKEVESDEVFKVENLPPVVSGDGKGVTLQSQITAPGELIHKLYDTAPNSRSGSTFDPSGKTTQLTTTRSTTNAPIGVDYHAMIYGQELYNGSLMDSNVAPQFNTDHTQRIPLPQFFTYPTVRRMGDGVALPDSDFAFRNVSFVAPKFGIGTEISNDFLLSTQVVGFETAGWAEIMDAMYFEIAEQTYVGDGTWDSEDPSAQNPHGLYTAAQESRQSGNTRTFAGKTGANVANDNSNRTQLSRAATSGDDFTTLDRLTDMWLDLGSNFRNSPYFSFHCNAGLIKTMLQNTAKSFESNQMYSWVNFANTPAGAIITHLNKPVYDAPWLNGSPTANGDKLIVAGDLKWFWVRRGPVTMKRDDSIAIKKDSVYFQMIKYVDTRVIKWSAHEEVPGPLSFAESTT